MITSEPGDHEGTRIMNNTLQNGIITLLRSALSGEAIPLPEEFDLTSAMSLIRKHHIGSLIHTGAVNCKIDPKLPAMQQLFGITYQYMCSDERQRHELSNVLTAFHDNGIEYMPLKGTLLKPLYPRPDMRIMGDADILIKLDQYDKIRPLLLDLGFEEKLESDHELIWTKPSLYLELHKHIIPSYHKDYASYFGNGWRLARQCPDNPLRYEMSDEDQLLYLFTHFAKHYRGGGVGIRHITDLYVYKKAKPHMNEKYISDELKQLQLYDFYRNICDTLSVWFEGGTHNEKTRLITDTVFGSGSFGTKETRLTADSVRDMAEGDNAKGVRRKKSLQMLFPPRQALCERYPVLEKMPVLLPFIWIVRWVTAVFCRRDNIKAQYSKIQVMKEDRINSYDQALRAVGLTFHFKE